MKNTWNNSLFRSFFFYIPRACLTITSVLMQSYNPAILGWDYLYGRGCRLACFVSERKRAFLLPCAIVWLGISVEVVELEALPIILQLATTENTTTYHDALCLSPKILHKRFFQFLLGPFLLPRETENCAYANFWGEKQRALWYVMVFSVVVNYNSILEFVVTWMCPPARQVRPVSNVVLLPC